METPSLWDLKKKNRKHSDRRCYRRSRGLAVYFRVDDGILLYNISSVSNVADRATRRNSSYFREMLTERGSELPVSGAHKPRWLSSIVETWSRWKISAFLNALHNACTLVNVIEFLPVWANELLLQTYIVLWILVCQPVPVYIWLFLRIFLES